MSTNATNQPPREQRWNAEIVNTVPEYFAEDGKRLDQWPKIAAVLHDHIGERVAYLWDWGPASDKRFGVELDRHIPDAPLSWYVESLHHAVSDFNHIAVMATGKNPEWSVRIKCHDKGANR